MPQAVRVIIEGEDALMDHLRRLDLQGQKLIRAKVRSRTIQWVANAQRITPDDPKTPGLLRESVRIIQPSVGPGKITGGIQAGGSFMSPRLGKRGYNVWAIVQHEDLTLHHPHGGQAKFLEIPFMRGVVALPDDLMDALDSIKP